MTMRKCLMNNFKTQPLFILSRFKEDPSWVKEYTDNYIIYNKGPNLDETFNTIKLPNIGGNQFDIAYFICKNYENLPDIMIFIQADPWDHCNREKFNKLIGNVDFTSLESYEHLNNTHAHIIDETGGYTEINNSWFIPAHNRTHNLTCKYRSYNEFMNKFFKDYDYPPYIRFAPGSQYLVPKKNALRYSRRFWKAIAEELPKNYMTEAHIVERSLYYILTGRYTERDHLK